VIGAIDQFDVAELAGFEHHAGHRLVDDGGRSATLGDQYFSVRHDVLLLSMLETG
jgi:hypothetical protein